MFVWCYSNLRSLWFVGIACGQDNVSVPWGDLTANPTLYFDVDCLPDDQKLKEPSKLVKNEIQAIFDHWLTRQRDKYIKYGLRFNAYKDNNGNINKATGMPNKKKSGGKGKGNGKEKEIQKPKGNTNKSEKGKQARKAKKAVSIL